MTTNSELAASVQRFASRWRRGPTVGESWERLKLWFVGTPERKRRTRKAATIGGPILLAAIALLAWLILRPVPQPDYSKDNLKKVFNFTLLTDEFNRLPVEERLKLLGELVNRLKGMSAGDSALMAAFAAGIAGKAREQMLENASRLAIDLWDKWAAGYSHVPPDQRDVYLDNAYVEFTKMMEAVGGESRDVSDAERLEEARRQAARDQKNMQEGRTPPARMMGRAFTFLDRDVGKNSSPQQRARGLLMMRDMADRMRSGPPK